ncbi:flavin reductase [Bradyrhizobium sp. USDA 4501]
MQFCNQSYPQRRGGLSLRFCGQDGATRVHRFGTASWTQSMIDVPLLYQAFCALECAWYDDKIIGTHRIFIGQVSAARTGHGYTLFNFERALRVLRRTSLE